MADQLRIGMVGCGSIAQAAGMVFQIDPRARMTWCTDVNLLRAQSFARRFAIKQVGQDFHEVIHAGDVDALYFAVPHAQHFEMIREAILASKPVLCEKPITTTLQDGWAVVELAEQKNIKVGINYQYRYDAAVLRLLEASRRGNLGKIHYARINVPWLRNGAYFEGWHGSKAQAGGGTLMTQGSHAIDFTQWIAGGRVKNAVGMIQPSRYTVEVEALALGVLELDNGCMVEVCSSMLAKPERGMEVEFYTEKGTARYSSQWMPKASFSGGALPWVSMPVWGIFAFQRSLNAFVRWVLGGKVFLTPAREAMAALESVLAIYDAAQRQPMKTHSAVG